MTYQEDVSFDGKTWYTIEWKDIDFRDFDDIEGIKDSKTIEELEKIVTTSYPNSDFKVINENTKRRSSKNSNKSL